MILDFIRLARIDRADSWFVPDRILIYLVNIVLIMTMFDLFLILSPVCSFFSLFVILTSESWRYFLEFHNWSFLIL